MKPLFARANVAEEADVVRAVGSALEATGVINGVVNTAGITRDARIPKKSFDDFKLVMAVHVHGTFLFTREVASQHWHPLFKANGDQPLDDGVNRCIMNFSSVSARNGNVGQVDYTAAKGAIEAPVAFAGHSLGQITALIASGCLPFDEGIQLAARRAEATQAAADRHPGRMAAVIGRHGR